MSKKTGTGLSNEPEDFAAAPLPVIEIALDKLRVDESKNLRRYESSAKSVESLGQSIKKRGLLQPLIVKLAVANGDGCSHELVAGYRRNKALHHIKATTALVRVIENDADAEPASSRTVSASLELDMASGLTNLDENLERDGLNYMDMSHAIKTFSDGGMKGKDIAVHFKKEPGWVSVVGKFVLLRPHIQKQIAAGKIAFRTARELVAPETIENEAAQDEILKSIESGGGASATVDKAKKKRKKDKRGRKSGGGDRERAAEGRGISAKQAISIFEGAVEILAEKEKKNKTEEKLMELYSNLIRFMTAAIGAKSLNNRILAAL